MSSHDKQELLRQIYHTTRILRRPLSGIVSGYHTLPYILVAPNDEDTTRSIEINGTINVSPKFVISPAMLQETFGDVFDSETFDRDIEGRMFSFVYSGKKNLKVESADFCMIREETDADAHLARIEDRLMQQENTRTGLIFCPQFQFYPVSIDRFISEIIDREMRV